jgi:aspartyl-tRNA synthetase
VLCVVGNVALRSENAKNPKMDTGEIEIIASELRILSVAATPPFEISDDCNTNEELRLKYRYLDLRRPDMQKSIMLRHRVAKIARDYYDQNGFLEIETPMLIKSTPEGARDYIVPSRVQNGKFYALPQSPQLYKQLLMLSGYDRYVQIVRCFRDEDLRADRQPEFTQIDLEMSFVDVEDVLTVNEGFLVRCFKEALGVELKAPFLRLTYKEAMERFGSDKPDIRFGFEFIDLTDLAKTSSFKVFNDCANNGGMVKCINIGGFADKFPRREIDSLTEFAKIYKAKGLAFLKNVGGEISSSFAKFLSEDELKAIMERAAFKENDLLLVVADKESVVCDALGALRCEIAKRLGLLKKDDFKFLWVTEFPLLEYDEEENRFAAKHHPFTAPMDEDLELLDTNPSLVRAKAYDIVLNGTEIGGGSLRIYSQELQGKMFTTLGFTEEEANEKFGFLLNAFKYGVPPHGGMAYGLDRLVMLMAGRDSIRDVIAFPKVQNASELMTNCPSNVEDKQLKELSIDIVKN